MTIDRSQRTSFEQVAELYDQARSGYPDELIDDILRLSAIPPDARLLEIGCGTGNATISFAKRGYTLLGIELGERLAAFAARNCRDYPKVKILNSAFEDWPVEVSAFDLALAFDSLHWIPPEIAYPKIVRALKAGGALALVFRVPAEQDTACAREIDQVYRETAPQFVNPERRFSAEWVIDVVSQAVRASRRFGKITIQRYFWPETETSEQYINGLRSFSSHQGIDEQTREKLYARIREVLRRHGDRVEQQASAVLFFSAVRKYSRP
jgi:SAM-dependent methyltransferase